MILTIVSGFLPSADCQEEIAYIVRRSGEWVFTRFCADGIESVTMNNTQQQSTEFIEMVADTTCTEVFIGQEDFNELALQATRAATFQSSKNQINLNRTDEKITVPIF